MRTERFLHALVAATAGVLTCFSAASCGSSGGDGSGDGGADQARQMFVDKVFPALAPTCSKCHATGERGAPVFLASNADGSYNAIEGSPGLVAPPSQSPLVQHGLHSGPALTPDQNDLVDKWLALEASLRNLGDPGKPANLRAAFKAFGACMDYAEWTRLGLDRLPLTDTDNSGKCNACHNEGQASTWLSADPAATFNHFTQFPYVQRLVVGTVSPSGAFDSITDSRRLIDKGTEAQQPQSNSHPRFSLPSAIAGNVTQFVANTISNMNANRCQNVALPDAGADAH